ncbi:MAG: class I SAM-dependent methyltransferase [Planctomycetes bacterium]|nr:class I SAM-dependent methyltransferase [Planctomycetota bacterium]
MSSFQKTYSADEARRYQELKKPGKHRAEMQLVERAFELVPREHRVLDAPCGYGRVMQHLHARGYRVDGADLSEAMLERARANLAEAGWSGTLQREDLQRLSYAERAFDSVVCFRVFHHFPEAAIRAQVISQLCRVARHKVVLSYFNPGSFTSRLSDLRVALGLKRPTRYPTSLRELERYFAPHGFRLEGDFARLRLVHSLHLCVWTREPAPEPSGA